MARRVRPDDLELYAINTGEFYDMHLKLVGKPLADWLWHVQNIVIPRYWREIEPIVASNATKLEVARNLMGYYRRHAAESKALAESDLREALSALVAACEAMPFARRPHAELADAWKVLNANQKDRTNV
jgi:hypothetical protein